MTLDAQSGDAPDADEAAPLSFDVSLDYLDGDPFESEFIDDGPVKNHLGSVLGEANGFVPSGTTWRVHITGDILHSANDLDESYSDGSFTVERGANTVAAKTIRQSDGSFDVVVSSIAWNMYENPEGDTEQSIADMFGVVRHTFLHEILHVAIDARGEDALTLFPNVEDLNPLEAVWTRHLGFMLEDYRIESALSSVAPIRSTWVAKIHHDLALFASDRARSYETAITGGDFGAGCDIMVQATVHLTRALAYLAAETNDPSVSLSGEDLERWNRFAAPTWDEWLSAYHEARPATLPMTTDEVKTVIRSLARLGPALMESVGFHRTINESGQLGAYWLHGFEW